MKFKVERADLTRGLSRVTNVCESRNTIPILTHVLLRLDGPALSVAATDLDLHVLVKVAASPTLGDGGPWSLACSGVLLGKIIRAAPTGAVISLEGVDEIEGSYANLVIRYGRSKFTLPCLPPDDFPSIDVGDLTHRFVLASDDLKKLIDKTQFAVSTEGTRYYLNGIFLHAAEVDGHMMLRAVATDGHLLARVEIPAPAGAVGMPGVIVPRKAVAEMRKLVEDLGAEVAIELSPTKVRFSFDDVVLTSKLIDGTFPDYARVIPITNDKRLVVECEPFAKALQRGTIFVLTRLKGTIFALSNGRLAMSTHNPDTGSVVEELAVDYDSGPMEIALPANQFLAILSRIDSDRAVVKLADAATAVTIQDHDDSGALYVLMPMVPDLTLRPFSVPSPAGRSVARTQPRPA